MMAVNNSAHLMRMILQQVSLVALGKLYPGLLEDVGSVASDWAFEQNGTGLLKNESEVTIELVRSAEYLLGH
jgi:hypothetical protein